MKTLLSLFDYSGNWSLPYQENGWNVILWDIKHTSNLFDLFSNIEDACADYFYEHIFNNFGTVDGILAAPPCTDFAGSGAQWWKQKDIDGKTDKSISIIYQILRIIDLCMPDFWVIENPVGRLNKLIPGLKEYGPTYFQPFWYGDPYTKKTGLWGKFNMPEPTNIVEPTEGSKMHKLYGGKSERTKELRSMTPMGFAYAFYDINN